MIPRYSLPEMSALWRDDTRFQRWLALEIFAMEAWATLGKVPRAAVAAVRARATIRMARIQELELTLKHDVIAFLTSLTEQVGAHGRFIHLGLTSSDVVDTALATQLRDALDLLVKKITTLRRVMRTLIRRHATTVMMGRTHGVHAEPTTFGLKVALWYDAFSRHVERLAALRTRIAVGKLSGAVGTYAHMPLRVERYVMRKMGLTPARISTQVVNRDAHAEFFSTLALIGASIEQIATEIRHLQRTEVREAEEAFTAGQKGSSAMPHKRNPILSENLCGLARLLRGYALASVENVALWHERDISHSSVERVIGPDACITLDFMLDRLTGLLQGLRVYPAQMRANLDLYGGVAFSQSVLLALIEKGLSRESAYTIMQRVAMQAWETHGNFRALVAAEPDVTAHLTPRELAHLFDPMRQLTNVDAIIDRVLHIAP